MRTHLLMTTTSAAALLATTSAQASRIFQEQPCRRTNGSRPFGLPLPKRPRLRATAVLASAALKVAARIAIPVIVLNGVSGVASAQNATNSTWGAPGANANWNTAANWISGTALSVPGPMGTANFTGNLPTSISMAGAVAVGTLQFTAPSYILNVLGSTNINGNGVVASLANAPMVNVISGAGGGSGFAINFNNSSSAGTAQYVLGQVVDTNMGFNAGFINFTGNSTAGQATITVRDASAVNFNDSSNAGQATLMVNNGGFIGFNDQSSGAQATVINNAGGEVGFFGLSTTGTTLGSIAGAGTFTLTSKELTVGSNNTSTEVSGTITGDGGSLVKVGSGVLTLSGANTYTGPTTVNAGVLAVDGSIASSSLTTVNSGAALIGGGFVGPTVINSGGFLAPGRLGTFGTLTVNGNLAFQSGSFYVVQVNPTTASNTMVNGSAALAGTVGAVFSPGAYVTNSYPILTASGGFGGTTFGGLVTRGLPADFGVSVNSVGNTAFLNLCAGLVPGSHCPGTGPTVPPPTIPQVPGLPPSEQPFPPDPPAGASAGASAGPPLSNFTLNQLNVGRTIDNFFNNGGALPPAFASLFNLTGNNLTTALNQLSGEAATGAQKVGFQLFDQFLDLMLDPFVDGRCGIGRPDWQPRTDRSLLGFGRQCPPLYEPGWTVWGGAYGGSNHTGGGNAGSHDLYAGTFGGAAGLDYHFTSDTVVGFAVGGAGTNWNLSEGLGGGTSDAFQAGVYGSTKYGPAYLSAAFAFSNNWMNTSRFAVDERLTANFNAQSYGGRLEGGYSFGTPYSGFTPYAAIQGQNFHTPGYSETAPIQNDFALGFGARDASDIRMELGARYDGVVGVYQNAVLALRGRMAWAHDWVSDPTLTPVFEALPGASFVVNGASLPQNSLLTSVGAELRFASGLSLLAKFDGEFASNSSTLGGTATLRYRW
jgi:autotransporter-associated beta strand protein